MLLNDNRGYGVMVSKRHAINILMIGLAVVAAITTVWVLYILLTPAIGEGTIIKEHVPVGRYYNGITLAKK